MFILKMALRNLGRNRRRSLITVVAIGLGLGLLIVSSGISDGTHSQMIEAGVSSSAGHVVVQGPGYQQQRQVDIAVPHTATVARELKDLFPAATIVPRIFMDGLLSSPNNSVGVGVTAIDPAVEPQVSDLHTKIVAGEYLDGTATGIVVGRTLAKTLDVDLGDKVVLMSQREGEIESRLFRIQGIFATGVDEVDGFHAQIPLTAAQQILGLGRDVTQLSVHLDSARQTREATAQTRAALAGHSVEVLPWMEALPELYEFVVLDDAGMYVFLLIIVFIVALGILNTVLMSVLERVREFGVMLALGSTPGRIASLILTEAFLLGLVAVVLGLALGLLGNWPLQRYGLDLAAALGGDTVQTAGVALDAHIYSKLSWAKVALFSVLALVLTVVAAVYPALKATRLRPVEAMRHR